MTTNKTKDNINNYVADHLAKMLSTYSYKDLSFKRHWWSKRCISPSIIVNKIKSYLMLLMFDHIVFIPSRYFNDIFVEIYNSDVYISIRYIYKDKYFQNNVCLRYNRETDDFKVNNQITEYINIVIPKQHISKSFDWYTDIDNKEDL